jgi:hypothetical protein
LQQDTCGKGQGCCSKARRARKAVRLACFQIFDQFSCIYRKVKKKANADAITIKKKQMRSNCCICTQCNLQIFSRKTDSVRKTLKIHNPEPFTSANIFVGEPQSEISHNLEDALQEPEIYDNNTLYKVPGSLSPPGESDKGIYLRI